MPQDDRALVDVPPLEAVFVTATACHLCRTGRDVLALVGERVPMSLREVGLTSPEGADIARRWRVPFPPILIVNGDLVAYGRLSRRRLERDLAARVQPQEA